MPGAPNQTKSNVRLINLNRTQSNPVPRLGSIEFSNRTQPNCHKKIGPIECSIGFVEFVWVRLSSIIFRLIEFTESVRYCIVDVSLVGYLIRLHLLKMVVVRECENTSTSVVLVNDSPLSKRKRDYYNQENNIPTVIL